MSVYFKENPLYLYQSIESMVKQTVKPDEIIIVKDGPLTEELESTLKEFGDTGILNVITLKENKGLGKALEIGLERCRNNFVARMDTDDISKKDRCEKQLSYLKSNPNTSLVGSNIAEFSNNINKILSKRIVPTKDINIKKTMKTKSPFNHPSVMFRKDKVIESGSYKEWYLNEDYYLWVRMLINGCEFGNIDEELLYMRVNDDTFQRRGGWAYFMTQKRLFDFMLKNKVISIPTYIYNNVTRIIVRLMLPNKIRAILYKKLLREN